jgi:hypothetical protein
MTLVLPTMIALAGPVDRNGVKRGYSVSRIRCRHFAMLLGQDGGGDNP